MIDLEAFVSLLRGDPVLAYSLLAALFLAAVSLVSGLARGDAAALLRPGVLLRVAAAVALAVSLALLADALAGTLGVEGGPWQLAGLRRWPLYLLALAYGPSVGLAAALLFAAFESGAGAPGWESAVLGLELVALGWLAIYPNPRRHRWAGPLNALLAYALAWGTAGLALLAWRAGAVTPAGVWQQHQGVVAGLLLSAILLLALGPRGYRTLFPHSRLAPEPPARPIIVATPAEPLERRRLRHDPKLTMPDLPDRLLRRDRERDLGPPPFELDDEPG